MAPKGNAKKEAGRAKKADNESKKKDAVAQEKEKQISAQWTDPKLAAQKSAKDEKEAKRLAELERKAENARLLAEEEKNAPAKVKAAPKAGKNKVSAATAAKMNANAKPAGPGAIASSGGLGVGASGSGVAGGEEPESYAATGLDNALDLLDVVTAKMDKASVGQAAAGIERHPERRFKAAYEAYTERELPIIRKEHPGLRLQQYKDLLYKQFQKAPENPFNQTTIAYDATKADKVDALKAKQALVEERLRERGESS